MTTTAVGIRAGRTDGESAKLDKLPTGLRYRIKKGFDEKIVVSEGLDNVSMDRKTNKSRREATRTQDSLNSCKTWFTKIMKHTSVVKDGQSGEAVAGGPIPEAVITFFKWTVQFPHC